MLPFLIATILLFVTVGSKRDRELVLTVVTIIAVAVAMVRL